jgi:DNA-binding transcriptional LysR family regulator
MALELRQLRYFVAVAEEGHVTRAAARLGMQQPPLSQQIKALEEQLSVRLFERLPRGVRPTEAGTVLLEQARLVLAQTDAAVEATKRAARGEIGTLAIGLTSSSSLHPFIPRVLRRFREAHPGVAVALEESSTVELVEGLRRGTVDVAFTRAPAGAGPELKAHPLFEEAMLAALPTNHALARAAKGKPLPLKALANENFVLYRRAIGAGLYDAIVTACGNAGFSPRVVQEAPRMLSTLSLVAAGLGVSIVPASMKRLAADGVLYRGLTGAAGLRAPIIMLHTAAKPSAVLERFVTLVLKLKGDAALRG